MKMSSFLQSIKTQISPRAYAKVRYLSQQSSKLACPNRVVVDTPSGKLRGTFQRSCLGDEYYAFKGIPYAKPPIGQLRFQDPQPEEPWSGIRDATSHSAVSYQFDLATKKPKGSEDCLYLNVYTRSLKESSRAAVMVWIPGGAYVGQSGNDDIHGPDFLIAKNIVLVTFNYRLGIFGFLNLEHEVALGNQGLKDQLLLLKWVKGHIASFGGDPDNVTVFGYSAGAASIQYLDMSPASKGLYNRAICQSAAVTCAWASRFDPKEAVHNSLALLGSNEREPKRVLDFLRAVDADTLIEVQHKLSPPMVWLHTNLPFLPRFDDRFEDPALPGVTTEAVERGVRVPLILGSNSNEGIFFSDYLRYFDLKDVDRNLGNYLHPRILKTLEFHGMTLDDLKKMYFDDEEISERNLDKLIELCGDLYLANDIRHLARTQLANGAGVPTYHYRFSFDKNLTVYKKQRRSPFKGANHAEELTYLFRMNICDTLGFEQLQEGTGADRVMRQMVEMWTNFAKTGKPIPEKSTLLPVDWQPLTKGSPVDCLDIGEELFMTRVLDVGKPYSGGTLF